MSKVFVLDTNKQPLHPVHPARARILLDSGKAAIFKRYPFTIILKVAIDHPVVAQLRIKLGIISIIRGSRARERQSVDGKSTSAL